VAGEKACVTVAEPHTPPTMARFSQFVTLEVDQLGLGTGTITLPNGSRCAERSCSQNMKTRLAPVTILASAASDSTFDGWVNADDCIDGTCDLVVLRDRTITAKFRGAFDLTVTKSGQFSGAGSVQAKAEYAPPESTVLCDANCGDLKANYLGGT